MLHEPRHRRPWLIFDVRQNMWKRRSAHEIDARKRKETRSPWLALGMAAAFSVITTSAWAFGIPAKYARVPVESKSVAQVLTVGPIYFLLWFTFFFVLMYVSQRMSGRSAMASGPEVYFCPACHTPQFSHERKCSCKAALEPLEHWKWV
jgi:hypothetical protein